MANSVLYATNSGSVSLSNGAVYSPSSITRRCGAGIDLGNNGVILKANGYYDVDVIATVSGGTATTNVVATLKQDGVAVPGGTVTTTVVAANDEVTLPISAIVRKTKCACQESVLTVEISGQATTGINLAFKVERL